MTAKPLPEPRKRRDLSLRPQSDAEIAAAAEITQSDVLAAAHRFTEVAPAPFKSLLDAQPGEEQ